MADKPSKIEVEKRTLIARAVVAIADMNCTPTIRRSSKGVRIIQTTPSGAKATFFSPNIAALREAVEILEKAAKTKKRKQKEASKPHE